MLAILVIALGINVTMHRIKLQVPLGDGGNAQMLRMVRLHGNAAEYIPLAAAMMLIYDVNGGLHIVLNAAGIALVVWPLAANLGNVVDGTSRIWPWPDVDLARNRDARRVQSIAIRLKSASYRVGTGFSPR